MTELIEETEETEQTETEPTDTETPGAEQAPKESAARWSAQRTAVPWYGLDEAWTGDRWLSTVVPGPDGTAEYGTLGHGDRPARRPDEAAPRKFCGVVTMAKLDRRPVGGGSPAFLEPTTLSALAAVAGLGLLADDWPWAVDKALRGQWLAQQTELAYEVAEELDAPPWRSVQLPVDGRSARFCYRESEYGWVLAAELRECWLGAYGRGISAYGLGFAQVTLAAWDSYSEL